MLSGPDDECTPCPPGALGQEGGWCYKCPSFTYPENDTCRVFDTLEQSNTKTKFQLGRLTQFQENSCNSREASCSGDFIGPFKDSRDNLFFFNFAKTSQFKHDLFQFDSYFTKMNASIVKLSPYSSQNEANFKHDKNVSVLASQLIDIQFVPANFNKSGLIFRYFGENDCAGAVCTSFLFFECSKEADNLAPELVFSTSTRYFFRWKTRFACSQCRTDQLNSFKTKCSNSEASLVFEEDSNCAIFSGDFGLSSSENAGFLDEKEFKEELAVFGIEKVGELGEPGEYVTSYTESQFCLFVDNLDSTSKWLFWLIPLAILVCLLICLGLFCRYQKLKSTYNRLLDRGNTIN